jgi:hypothetical protein
MERGPMALFGAIVAVGLGPALWLGVQFGGLQIFTERPPLVSEQRPGDQNLVGGRGAAADSPADPVLGSTPRSNVLPITSSPSATPSGTRSASPTRSSGPSRSPSAQPSASPTSSPSATASTAPSTAGGDPAGGLATSSAPPSANPVSSLSGTAGPAGGEAGRRA